MGQKLCGWNCVLPLDVKYPVQTGHEEVVKLSGMSAVHCPCLASIELGGHDNSIYILVKESQIGWAGRVRRMSVD